MIFNEKQVNAANNSLMSGDWGQAILDAGYEEDFFVSNVKIGLGSLTCEQQPSLTGSQLMFAQARTSSKAPCDFCRIVIALLAQFYPKKYPDNWLLLLICLVLYGIGTAILSVFTTLVEDDSFLITRPRKARSWAACPA